MSASGERYAVPVQSSNGTLSNEMGEPYFVASDQSEETETVPVTIGNGPDHDVAAMHVSNETCLP